MCILLEKIDRIIKLKNIVEGTEAQHIIKYVKENPGTTMDKVAKNLKEQDVCSRLTTLKVIERLLSIGMLIDKNRGKKYFHSLYYNEDYDFGEYGSKLLKETLTEIKDAWSALSEDEQYMKLLDDLINYTVRFKFKKRSKDENK